MGGEHSDEYASTVPIAKQKCAHGCYNPGELSEPNRMCSVCMSAPAPKKELIKAELQNAKKENNFWK